MQGLCCLLWHAASMHREALIENDSTQVSTDVPMCQEARGSKGSLCQTTSDNYCAQTQPLTCMHAYTCIGMRPIKPLLLPDTAFPWSIDEDMTLVGRRDRLPLMQQCVICGGAAFVKPIAHASASNQISHYHQSGRDACMGRMTRDRSNASCDCRYQPC